MGKQSSGIWILDKYMDNYINMSLNNNNILEVNNNNFGDITIR